MYRQDARLYGLDVSLNLFRQQVPVIFAGSGCWCKSSRYTAIVCEVYTWHVDLAMDSPGGTKVRSVLLRPGFYAVVLLV